MLFTVQSAVYLPTVAHTEHYPGIKQHPELARRLVDRGVVLQLTIGSFTCLFGRSAKRAAETLLSMGRVHLVAIGGHSAGHRMASVPAGFERLRDIADDESLRRLSTKAPAMLFKGASISPLPAPARSGLRRLLVASGH